MQAKDQAVLLGLMQSQVISETKYGKTRQTHLKCSVFATSNSTKKMLDPLLSRFVVIKVGKYSYEQFKEVAMKMLMDALGLGHANFDGNLMAEKVNDGTNKVSECEVKAVLKANYWKLIADGTEPVMPEKNGIMCTE